MCLIRITRRVCARVRAYVRGVYVRVCSPWCVCVECVCVHSATGLAVLVLFFVFHLLDARFFYFFDFFIHFFFQYYFSITPTLLQPAA